VPSKSDDGNNKLTASEFTAREAVLEFEVSQRSCSISQSQRKLAELNGEGAQLGLA
jgi:hypothetical protein